MPFPRERRNDPASIGMMTLSMSIEADNSNFKAVASFQLKKADGSNVRIAQHDLAEHLTADQQDRLKNIMIAIRQKAINEILPN